MEKSWLEFLNTYRALCLAPRGDVRFIFERLRANELEEDPRGGQEEMRKNASQREPPRPQIRGDNSNGAPPVFPGGQAYRETSVATDMPDQG
jgi:hypothetical protein